MNCYVPVSGILPDGHLRCVKAISQPPCADTRGQLAAGIRFAMAFRERNMQAAKIVAMSVLLFVGVVIHLHRVSHGGEAHGAER